MEIRLGISARAAQVLGELRVRRLVEIEAGSSAFLATGLAGPLSDRVAYVWVDQPSAARVIVEVRVGDHPVERREIAVRGLASDVAARLVAIAVAEMTRAGSAPKAPPAPRPAPAPRRTPEELERASRTAPALMMIPAAVVGVLPASGGVLAGPSFGIGFRSFGVSETIFARWLAGPTHNSDLRWMELGASVEYRLWLGPRFRLAFGGEAALSSVHVGEATSIEAQTDQRETWSARAGGLLAFEARLSPSIWLSLSAAPGAVLRPLTYASAASPATTVKGPWIGFGLAVHFERVHLP